MTPILPQLEKQIKFAYELACPAHSDCCSAPVERVADELLACTVCGHLCDEADFTSLRHST